MTNETTFFGTLTGKARVDLLMGNLQTTIFHQNSETTTNTWAAESIGKAPQVESDWIIELDDREVRSRFVKVGLQADAEYLHLSKVRIYGD